MGKVMINRDAGMIAYEINIIKDQTNKFLLQSSIEIGNRLKEAKEMIGHGKWEKWLGKEVSYSNRTASNLMRIYDEYGDNLLKDPNRKSIADLNYTQAIAMLKLDFDERENFVLENDVKEMSVKELNDSINEKLELKREKETLEKKLKTLENKESELGVELQEKIKKIKEYETSVKEKTSEVLKLKKAIEKIESSDSDANELSSLQSEIDERQSEIIKKDIEIKKLKDKLKEKPKEVEIKQIAYETPPAVLKELEDLKAKLGASESEVKFKAAFELLLNRFNDLISILDSIKETEVHEKYKNAINKLLIKLAIPG